jgi:hypothetical protein
MRHWHNDGPFQSINRHDYINEFIFKKVAHETATITYFKYAPSDQIAHTEKTLHQGG